MPLRCSVPRDSHLRSPSYARSIALRCAAFVGLLMTDSSPFAVRASAAQDETSPRPNIILINADDLGFGEIGCYGQTSIETPHLDRMAREGMRFRNFYAGATVCAPSRCTMMTGRHNGHAWVRGNAGADVSIQALREEEVTFAEVARDAGYRTALVGKWGLGDRVPGAESGLPDRQGFDFFFGYLNQVHAHNHFPAFLWRDDQQVRLRNEVVEVGNRYAGFVGGYATKRIDYAQDLLMDEAIGWLETVGEDPFLLVLAPTIPHANNEGTRGTGNGQEVPSLGNYADRDWSEQDKGQAAMITWLDSGVGRLLDHLKASGLDRRTIVLFTSDNGPHAEGGRDTSRFVPAGPLRGKKRDLYEGGIRVPLIVWGPGRIEAGQATDQIGYHGDLMATIGEWVQRTIPTDCDSVSLVPTLEGRPSEQQQHRFLYWEFYEQGGRQAVRFGRWKAIREPMLTGPIELYDLQTDLGESSDVAAAHPDLVRQATDFMDQAHQPNPNWVPRGTTPAKPVPGHGRMPF